MTDIFEANGAKFLAQDDMIVRWCRAQHRPFEPETTAWLFERIPARGGLFVDVGAATGWFAIPAALRGAEVVAIEANARVARRLAANMEANGLTGNPGRVTVHQVAASDRTGTARFMFNPLLPLTSGGSLERPSSAAYETEKVVTERLDALVSAPVGVMKIDVEGHEIAVLRGARRIIGEDRPDLVLEANTEAHVASLAAWLEERDYSWTRADERNMLCRAG